MVRLLPRFTECELRVLIGTAATIISWVNFITENHPTTLFPALTLTWITFFMCYRAQELEGKKFYVVTWGITGSLMSFLTIIALIKV